MITSISHITLLVRDQEEALAFFRDKLGFEVKQDELLYGFRWLVVGPMGHGTNLVLVPSESDLVGKQAGGRVLMVVATDDIERACEELKAKGVAVRGQPNENAWGTDVEFEDLYGNKYDLVEARSRT